MNNDADEDDDDDDHAEEVTASLSKMTKIVNNLIARADSIPFREPGKTSLFSINTTLLCLIHNREFDVYQHPATCSKKKARGSPAL